jgi:hypothetical protein
MRSLLVRSLLASATLALGSASAQTTIHVPADWPTIQAAILAAVDGDTVLVAPGTYVEELDYLGKAITVASESGATATILANVNSAVTFQNDEGPGSILRGFTVTGNNSGRAAIHGPGTSPRIVQCEIRGNRTSSTLAAGVFCDGTLVDCVVEDNHNGNGTGGVAGALTLQRCLLRGNTGYDGAAALLLGGGMEDCRVLDNSSAEGSAGGAVSISSAYPVTLTRCVIAGNSKDTWSGQYAANGAGLSVQAFSVPATLVNCTVVGNRVPVPGSFGPDHGGVHGQVTLQSCIVGDNDGLEFQAGVTTATYSNLEGGLAGTGNFDADPLFRDASNGDYRLLAGSPCIETGDPTSPLDPDGTRADAGALEFTHATAFALTGSGANPTLLVNGSPPAIGTSWQAAIVASLVPGTTLSAVQVRTAARTTPLVTSRGEILIAGARLGQAQVVSNGSLDALSFALPPDAALLGLAVHAQGYVISLSFGLRLGNGLTLLIGE